MSSVRIRPFTSTDADAVVALWQAAGLVRPWNDPYRDITRKLSQQPELFVVAVDEQDRVVGSVMAGFDGHRGWMNYLAAATDTRGLGIGRALVEHVEHELRAVGCPKLNLQVRTSNSEVIAFYRHLGYQVDDVVSMGRRLIEDPSPSALPTADSTAGPTTPPAPR
ncbi:GNAT family acetyltransferase [Propionibacteriaceae bacterium Y1923]|uniref:GNAT family acetyltransferase n=1 Tax=Aestuariimicrobium sp. Y1814 TaxID=3418742 RepID=UPI003C1CD318